MSKGSFKDFLDALAVRESGDNYSAVASLGYLGRYQFAEAGLEEIGFYNGDSTEAQDYIGTWTSEAAGFGATSKASFLASHAAQDEAANQWFTFLDNELARLGMTSYIGKTMGGVVITESGMLAGAHLIGLYGLKAWLEGGGSQNSSDPYGTSVTEYLQKFADYDTPVSNVPAAPGGSTGGATGGGATSGSQAPAATSGNDNLVASATAPEIHAGAGADTVSASGFAGSTYLRGDDGNDSLQGGSGFDDINGNIGDDTARGGDGGDWVVGGRNNDQLFGDAGDDIVYGNLGADRCEGGAGNDTVRGGQEDDVVLGGIGADWLSGDRGSDTLTGGTGGDIFHTFGAAGIDRVTDFSRADGDRVMLDPGTAYTLAQQGADTVISMQGGGQMVLVGVQLSTLSGDWIFGA